MSALFGINSRPVLLTVATLFLSVGAASAQMCPQPYAQAVSEQTGNVCTSSCAVGSYPALAGASATCTPGYAAPTCPDGDAFLVMTPAGPVCQTGYTPVADANNGLACKTGDVRVERPPYQLNGALSYETCAPAPSCPPGYIETVDPDNALGTSRVCMLPCQDFVMNQAMACSCGAGGRLAAHGSPVHRPSRFASRMCPAGSLWQASSPLLRLHELEQGPVRADRWWPGQLPPPKRRRAARDRAIGTVRSACRSVASVAAACQLSGLPRLPGWVLTGTAATACPITCDPAAGSADRARSGTGCYCVAIGPKRLPAQPRHGTASSAFPSFVQNCPPDQYWNGTQCVPKPVVCLPPNKLVNGQCVPPQGCVGEVNCINPPNNCQPPNKVVNGVCVPPPGPNCKPPFKLENGKCVLRKPEGCVPPNKMVNGECVHPGQPCEPPKHLVNGVCVSQVTCEPPNHLVNGVCVPKLPCPPPKHLENGQCV